MPASPDMRNALLEAVGADPRLPFEKILRDVAVKLNVKDNLPLQQAILAQWQNLFTTGFLAWGRDLENPQPPKFHVTDRGKDALKQLSRDPSNPDGYMNYLADSGLDDVADSYIREALQTYSSSCYKATAVLLGGAAERLILVLRDAAQARLATMGRNPNKKLADWQVKRVADELHAILSRALDDAKAVGDAEAKRLHEPFTYQWPSLIHGIRAARNDAGHPKSIEPVTPENVHADLLTFPHVAILTKQMKAWIPGAPLQ